MRAYLSKAAFVGVGVLIGALIGVLAAPAVRGDTGEVGSATAVTQTGSPAAPSAAPSVSGTGADTIPAPPTFAVPTATPIPGAPSVFDPSQPVTVGFGDSITYNADSWFRQLCTGGVLLQNCMNSAIRGNTTTQMVARLDSDVLVYRPAIVLVMGGTNDLKRHLSTQEILRRLDVMVDRARSAGATTVICTIPPRNGYGKAVLELNAAIRKYATRGHVPLLDLYEAIGNPKGTYNKGLTRDGIHPNLKGADLMTAAAEQQLPTLLHPVRDSPEVGRLAPTR